MQLESSQLPQLPGVIDDLILRAIDGEGASRVRVSARSGSRFTPIATFDPDPIAEGGLMVHRFPPTLRDRVIESCTAHCVTHGRTTLRVEHGKDSGVWEAYVGDRDEIAIAVGTTPLTQAQLLDVSWQITFRAAQKMLDVCAVAPGLIREVSTLVSELVTSLRETSQQSEAVTVAVAQADASTTKLNRLISLAEKFVEGPAGGTAPSGEPRWRVAQRKLSTVPQAAELARLAGFEPWLALIRADSPLDLATSVKSLWGAVSRGDVQLSQETLDAARKIVREHEESK